jgi:hypothetical protein
MHAAAAVDYAERVEDVLLCLLGGYGVNDREAVEILLASRLECSLPYPWVVVESSFYGLTFDGSWFDGITPNMLALAVWRLQRPRNGNNEIKDLLRDRDYPRTFLESAWEAPTEHHHRLVMWPYFMQECVRLRVKHLKKPLPDEGAAGRLRASVNRALDSRWRDPKPLKIAQPPPGLTYYCEVLHRISPWQRSWESLLRNLCALAARRAYLFNRDIDKSDWQAVGRVMHDSIPDWITRILKHLGSARKLDTLRGVYTDKELGYALRFLTSNAVIYNHSGVWHLTKVPEIREGVTDLLEGVLFS